MKERFESKDKTLIDQLDEDTKKIANFSRIEKVRWVARSVILNLSLNLAGSVLLAYLPHIIRFPVSLYVVYDDLAKLYKMNYSFITSTHQLIKQ